MVRRWCSGYLFFCSLVIQQLSVWTQKIEANIDYRYIRRRAARPWTQASKPTLTDSSLAAKRRVLHIVFFQQGIRAQHVELLLCVYSRMIRSHERRALGALLFLFSRSEPASTDS